MVQIKRPLGPNNGAPFLLAAGSSLDVLNLIDVGYQGPSAYLRLYAQTTNLQNNAGFADAALLDAGGNTLGYLGRRLCAAQDRRRQPTVNVVFEGVIQGEVKVELRASNRDIVFWGDYSARAGSEREVDREIRPLTPDASAYEAPYNSIPVNLDAVGATRIIHETLPGYLDHLSISVSSLVNSPPVTGLLKLSFSKYPDAPVYVSSRQILSDDQRMVGLFDGLPVRDVGTLAAEVTSTNGGSPGGQSWAVSGYFSRSL